MRIVLDTNIIVSRSISPDGPSSKLYTYWQAAAFDVVVSEAILTEYRQALSKARVRALHQFSDEEIEQTIESLLS
jgi:putative PIN family toxin of toxin-antitoxin system